MVGLANRTKKVYVRTENVSYNPQDFVTFDIRTTHDSYIVENFRHPTIKAITYDAGPLQYGLDWEDEEAVKSDVINHTRTYIECLRAAGISIFRTVV